MLPALSVLTVSTLAAFAAGGPAPAAVPSPVAGEAAAEFAGSRDCRRCHERFYELWAPSWHGRAMQPLTPELAHEWRIPATADLVVGDRRYRVELSATGGRVVEPGPEGDRSYPIRYVLGGKNVAYFLTPMERGRLQVLPVAFDARRREWFDTTASAMRHFPEGEDEVVDWRDPALTFNTSCFGCHVSQLSTNYDLETDAYETRWAEPGINCETCHGPGEAHGRAFAAAPEGTRPAELGIIRTKSFTLAQTNELCAPCHAKMAPITASFRPGERFFDNYDLVTLEHRDFYPDGRDLGENYTYTLWLTSPCVESGELDCEHCHTPSGRYRFAGERPNDACMPCHAGVVEEPAAHTHHPAESEASLCVSCHMPRTSFARMERHDHSMRPPTPAATIEFESPNACNLCHTERDAAWADGWVRRWRKRDYQAPVLRRARLVDAARKRDWSRLPEMLAYVTNAERDEVFAASIVRMLWACDDERIPPALTRVLDDPSPLVRASAVDVLAGRVSRETVGPLLDAAADDFRLVRVRAAAALAALWPGALPEPARTDLENATRELVASLHSRPDDYAAHYNLGNLYLERGDAEAAVASYETATMLRPDAVPPRVNAAHAYNRLGETAKAEASLRRALRTEPDSVPANLNLGLLLGELGRHDEARSFYRKVLEVDPTSAVAAYNLCVLLADERAAEAISWCTRAVDLRPDEPRYALSLAFYERRRGNVAAAIDVLRGAIARGIAGADAYLFLGEILETRMDLDGAADLYREALAADGLTPQERVRIEARLRVVTSR